MTEVNIEMFNFNIHNCLQKTKLNQCGGLIPKTLANRNYDALR